MTKLSHISVIIPVYNAELYLGEAIESVLVQNPQPREIIVVDDGSTDGSRETAKRFAPFINLIVQSNKGTAAAKCTRCRSVSDRWPEGYGDPTRGYRGRARQRLPRRRRWC